jgi:hypothetical protein
MVYLFHEQLPWLGLMKDSRSAKYLNSSSVKPVNPPNRLRRSGSRVASPDLPSESGIVVNNANLHTALCGTSSRGQARGGRRRLPAPQIGSLFSVRYASAFISMPGPAQHLVGAAIQPSINRSAALEADSHAA